MVIEQNESDENYSDPDECGPFTLQHRQGGEATVVPSSMWLEDLFLIFLVMRIVNRYEDVCIDNLIEFFDELDIFAIPGEQLQSHLQTLFENDDTDMERLWNELGFEVFLPDREDG